MIKVILLFPGEEEHTICDLEITIEPGKLHELMAMLGLGILSDGVMWEPCMPFYSVELKALCIPVQLRAQDSSNAGEVGLEVLEPEELVEQEQENAPPLSAEERRKLIKVLRGGKDGGENVH